MMIGIGSVDIKWTGRIGMRVTTQQQVVCESHMEGSMGEGGGGRLEQR